ncbi:MAG: 4-phosphoerythronate dehydrogenase [Ignavibacteriales bacterium]|nr:4-phosphoerythronate dehydrogenase [Ignavibacteriales bacterium]
MNILVDENITFAKAAFSNLGKVCLIHGRKIDRRALKNIDVLIIRSITDVNENLLKDTRVKFVGTATIGFDHVDINYLKERKIAFANAAGCNSDAVTEYVFTALLSLSTHNNFSLKGKNIGIIGAGNIGSRVASIAKSLGMNVLQNDPPLERKTKRKDFVGLNDVLNSDIISLHIPLNLSGVDKTFHLINENNLKLIKPGSVLINTSRGPVVDNSALLNRLKKADSLISILDVWENEPKINSGLLSKIKIGTAHIAGYSFEGKVNGTVMIYNQLCNFLNEEPKWKPILPNLDECEIKVDGNQRFEAALNTAIKNVYNINYDDSLLRSGAALPPEKFPDYFDKLRKEYRYRREFSNYKINLEPFNEELASAFKQLRFEI